MKRAILTLLVAGLASAVSAQPAPSGPPIAAPPAPAPPRAPGPPLALAVEAAQTAIATCLGNGYKTTAMVADTAGLPVATLTADGATIRTMEIVKTKIATVLKYGVPSGDIADRVKTDAALAAAITADPAIGTARRGGLPIKVGDRTIGIMAVSGAPAGEKDEACVKAGLERIAGRLK